MFFFVRFQNCPRFAMGMGGGDSRFLYSVFLTMTYGGGEIKTDLAAFYRYPALSHARVNALWPALLLIYYNNMNTIIICKASNYLFIFLSSLLWLLV